MARLPIIGSDSNAWGSVLNTFLSVAHNADGSIKNYFVNVKDPAYGAMGDGITDDTVAITAAGAVGGIVYYPPGTYLTGNLPLAAHVYHMGAGPEATIIRLKSGANTDLFSAQTSLINLAASFLTGPAGTLYDFGMCDLTLDGNKAGQTSGPSYPLRFYGANYLFDNVVVRNGYSGGVQCDWNGVNFPTNSIESRWRDIKIGYCNGIGFEMGGPHDSQMEGIIPFCNQSHGFHFGPNAGGMQALNCHAWTGSTGLGMTYDLSAVGWLVECTIRAIDCIGESYSAVQVALLGSVLSSWVAGDIFTSTGAAPNALGLQLGQTPTFGSDTFAGRTVASGFGTGSDGQAWNFISGDTTKLSVGTSEGTIVTSVSTQILTYGTKIIADVDVTTRFKYVSSVAETDFLCLLARRIDANNYYEFCASQDRVYIVKVVAGTATTIGTQAKTLTGGTFYHIRGRVQGSTLQVRLWQDGSSEPSTWDVTVTDTSLSGHGQYGILAFAGSGITIDTYVVSQVAYKGSVFQSANGLATAAEAAYNLIDTICYGCNAGAVWAINENNNRLALQASNTSGKPLLPMPISATDTYFESNSKLAVPGPVQIGASSSIYSGTGVPSSGTGSNGDFYFRMDTPGTANQRLYVKSAGTWVGII